MKRTYSHIDLDERRKIARWRMAGLSVGIIAEKLGRHRSTIFRELKRNVFVDAVVPDLSGYYCVTAHGMARERRAKLRKLLRYSHVRQSVIERIMYGWSPQQISGRMRLERHPISVSHETIYKFAYSADGHAIKLWRHLPEHRARRRPRHARRKHGQRFSPELNILRRPDNVADRKQFGHWECDLIQFRKKFGKANITSLVERVSRFCDPQSPWQKGTVENTNGRVRKWLSREVDPLTVTDADLVEICSRLNGTPRKCLGYRTPAEVFRKKVLAQIRHAG
jgi:IS30 family transposase